MWHLPMQRTQLLIAKPHMTDWKLHTFELKASSIAPGFGQQTVDQTQQSPEPYITRQTLLPAATVSKCQQKPSSTDKGTKSKELWRSRDAGSLTKHISTSRMGFSPGLIDRALSHWVRAPPLDGEEAMSVTQSQGQTLPYQMMTMKTSPLSPVNNPHHRSTQTSGRARLPRLGATCSLTYQHALELGSPLRRPRRMFLHHHRLP